jgi:hypothetical protein
MEEKAKQASRISELNESIRIRPSLEEFGKGGK